MLLTIYYLTTLVTNIMKTLLSLILIFINIFSGHSQSMQPSCKTIKTEKSIYEIKSLKDSKNVTIRNIKDTILIKKNSYDGDAKISFNENGEINLIAKEIFTKNLDSNIYANKKLAISFLINSIGVIKSIDFTMEKSLLKIFRLKELEEFETKLKEQIHPKVIKFDKKANYTSYTYILKFETLRN